MELMHWENMGELCGNRAWLTALHSIAEVRLLGWRGAVTDPLLPFEKTTSFWVLFSILVSKI